MVVIIDICSASGKTSSVRSQSGILWAKQQLRCEIASSSSITWGGIQQDVLALCILCRFDVLDTFGLKVGTEPPRQLVLRNPELYKSLTTVIEGVRREKVQQATVVDRDQREDEKHQAEACQELLILLLHTWRNAEPFETFHNGMLSEQTTLSKFLEKGWCERWSISFDNETSWFVDRVEADSDIQS